MSFRKTVKAILSTGDGKVLARVAKGDSGIKFLELPGGGVDSGERSDEAMCRELLEETGIRPGSLRQVCTLQQVWPESMKKNDRWARKNFKKYKGSEITFYVGTVGSREAPTSEEGDAWPALTSYPIDEVIDYYENHAPKEWSATSKGALKALYELKAS